MPRLVAELDAGTNRITNLAQPIESSDAVRFDYVQTLEANVTRLVQLMAVLRSEIDALKSSGPIGASRKASVVVASVEPINLAIARLIAIQGVGLVPGDRVLLTGQVNPAENGIYVVANGVWQRSVDADQSTEFTIPFEVDVLEGDKAGLWRMKAAPVPVVLGTTPLYFEQLSSTSQPRILPVERGGTGADNPRSARFNLGCVEQVSYDFVGDGVNTTFRLTHGLNQIYPIVRVFDRQQPKSLLIVDEYPIDEDTIEIVFAQAPPANSIAVTILGTKNPEVISQYSP